MGADRWRLQHQHNIKQKEVKPVEKLRIGILGFGYIGKYHARAVKNSRDAVLAGLWTRSKERQQEFSAQYPDSRVFSSMEQMAESSDIDAVAVCLPNKFHYPATMLFMEHRKHVLVEKPMSMNASEAEQMAEKAHQTGCALLVGHMWRFDEEVQALHRIVQADKLGRIVKTKGYGIHVNWGPKGWFTKKKLAGGGALADMGVHAIDTVRYLLGDPEPYSVYACIQTAYGNYDVDDTGVIIIRWKNSTVSIIESGWWQVHADGLEASTQLFGTRGYARLFPTSAVFNDSTPSRWQFQPKIQKKEHCDQRIYDSQMQEFVAAITQGRQPVPGPEHGITIMKIVDAAYRSAALNEVAKI